MNKQDALNKFVLNNYSLLNEKDNFDKHKYKEMKKDYFGRVLKHQFGIPRDKEICDCFVERLIKSERILDEATLEQAISRTPFLKINNITPSNYGAIIASISGKYAIQEETEGLPASDKMEKQLEWLKKVHSKEIEDLITVKKVEYLRLPSILDDVDFEEPEQPLQRNVDTAWWEDLNLKENPFPGPLDGFYMIDKSLYEHIIVETEPIRWALDKLEREPLDIFHRGFLLAGEFGTGKTTFYDFISPHLIIKHIEPIRIALTENINEAGYVQKFEKEVCIEIAKLTTRYNLRRTGPLIDFDEARIQMLDMQKIVKGFLIFIDDLHKHTNLDLVFRFLSHLQIIKNNFSRDGINVVFIVAGFPIWREKIKQDSSMTGFFDAPDQLIMPEVTPALAAQAIKKRLQTFAMNPNKELGVKEEFLKSIFKRVCLERELKNIGFRPYIQEAVQRFQQKQFDILSIDITTLDSAVSKQIKGILDASVDFTTSINKLIFGGGIKKKSNREITLRTLCEIYLRKGVTENEEFFNDNKFHFKRLSEAGLIQKYDRQTDNQHILVWNISPLMEDLNKDITAKFRLSMEDYLIPVYLETTRKTDVKREKTKIEVYEQDLKSWQKEMDPHIITSVQKALTMYSENIFQFTQKKSYSSSNLPAIDKVQESIWTMMKSIIRYESPLLLDICGETEIEGWALRHRSLQSSEYFINLLHDSEKGDLKLSDHTRLISFADEAFGELWNDFKESINVYRNSGITCYMLPKKVLRTIYAEYSTLLSTTGQHLDYFASLGRFVEMIEQSLRQYLLISSILIFGTYHVRLRHYPEEVRKYVTKKLPSLSTSYEGYNEFENLNRGQYRLLFVDSGKSTPFHRHVIKPVIGKWDQRDISAFFEIFGDMNIITSHGKISLAEDSKRDIHTFFRLACRLIADMSIRLKSLLSIENTILVSNDNTYMLFGPKDDETIFHHDITKGLKSNALIALMSSPDNNFGCVELEMLEIEETRIKFGREFCEVISLIAYYLSKKELLGQPLYGASIWLRET